MGITGVEDRPHAAPPRPGRPRTASAAQRRARLIDAAEAVFLERGFHAATMDDVAQQAGMSKKTIYQVVPTKAALFDALLIDRLSPLTMPLEEDGLPLAESLVALLVRVARFVLSAQQIALVRLMVAESPRAPHMTAALIHLKLGRGGGPLERWVAQKTGQGLIDLGDPEEAAALLFGMMLGDAWCAQLLNLEPCPSEAEIRTRAERCAGLVLRQPAPPAPPARTHRLA